jgi:hypothetical protein
VLPLRDLERLLSIGRYYIRLRTQHRHDDGAGNGHRIFIEPEDSLFVCKILIQFMKLDFLSEKTPPIAPNSINRLQTDREANCAASPSPLSGTKLPTST